MYLYKVLVNDLLDQSQQRFLNSIQDYRIIT